MDMPDALISLVHIMQGSEFSKSPLPLLLMTRSLYLFLLFFGTFFTPPLQQQRLGVTMGNVGIAPGHHHFSPFDDRGTVREIRVGGPGGGLNCTLEMLLHVAISGETRKFLSIFGRFCI